MLMLFIFLSTWAERLQEDKEAFKMLGKAFDVLFEAAKFIWNTPFLRITILCFILLDILGIIIHRIRKKLYKD